VTAVEITSADVPALAAGCAVLGTGGGGHTYEAELMTLQALGEYGPVDLVALEDLPPDGILLPLGHIGAPTVSLEKLDSGMEAPRIRDRVEQELGREVVGVMASEIGGANGVLPVAYAARLGVPIVDADAMGRAFPEVQMVSMHVAGRHPDLIVLCDVVGSVVSIRARSGEWAERIARQVTVAFGGTSLMADYVMPVAEMRGAVIRGSVSRALAIGRALLGAADDPVAALADVLGATRLLEGKVVDVERRTTGGFVRGSAAIEGTGADAGRLLRVEIQNEFLATFEDGEVAACVPDLITAVDAQSGMAVPTELLRYGQRVVVLAFACDPLWRSARGLEVAGPRAFGYAFDYVPLEEAARVRTA
jgi:uncharacterized protein